MECSLAQVCWFTRRSRIGITFFTAGNSGLLLSVHTSKPLPENWEPQLSALFPDLLAPELFSPHLNCSILDMTCRSSVGWPLYPRAILCLVQDIYPPSYTCPCKRGQGYHYLCLGLHLCMKKISILLWFTSLMKHLEAIRLQGVRVHYPCVGVFSWYSAT